MKKRVFFGLLVLLVAVAAGAQVQYGYVKTKGTASKRGERLNGVTVSVRGGSSVVSAGKGEFSFNPPGKSFSFSSVSKSGYILTDKDFLGRNFVASGEWKVIVMEKPEQRAKEVKIIKEKVNKTLEADIKKKEAEIARLEKEGKKSAAEIRKLKKQLYDAIDANEKLVEEMAEKLVSIDYDQMDDVNRQAAELILNGELEKAKKLLDSQGDINEIINDVNKKKEETLKAQNHAADLCYNKYNLFLLQHQNDSAAYYLEKRVELDPTNVQWQLEAGDFIREYLAQYDKAKSYYESALQLVLKNGERSADVATCYNNIGLVLDAQGKYPDALGYYQKALEIDKEIYGERHPDVAACYNNIGMELYYQGNYDEALVCCKKALEIRTEIYGEQHSELATNYDNVGSVLRNMGNYSEALVYYKKSLEINMGIYGDNHPTVASSYYYIGSVLRGQGDYSEALEYNKKSLDIRKIIYGEHHPDVAASYNSIGLVLDEKGDCSEALHYFKKSLEINKEIYGEFHPSVAAGYNNIGSVLYNQGDLSEALECYKKVLEISKEIYGERHPDVATFYNGIGLVLYNLGNYSEALDYLKKSLEIFYNILGPDHPDTKLVEDNVKRLNEILGEK